MIPLDGYLACPGQGRRTVVRRHERDTQKVLQIANLAQTGSEDYDFVDFSHFLEEVVDTWALYHVHIVPVVFNLHRDNIVRLCYRLYSNVQYKYTKANITIDKP